VTLVAAFDDIAQRAPQRKAIVEPSGRSITFSELVAASHGLARRFRDKGIGKSDRVLVGVWPSIELYSGLAALWRLGAIAVFPEPATGLRGFLHAAADTRPKALLAPAHIQALSWLFRDTRRIPFALSPRLAHGEAVEARVDADDIALISFTSGSTGTPKAMARSHQLLLAQHRALASLIASEDEETDLVAFPAFVLTCLGHGATAVLPAWNMRQHDRARAETILRQISEQRVTRLLVPPSIVATLAGHAMPTHVKRVLTGGGPVYPDIIRKFLRASPGTGLTVVYGSTEAEPISHVDTESLGEADWKECFAGGGLPVGHPVPEIAIKLRDEEITVAGAHVNQGYLDPARDAETKIVEASRVWHRTGDRGRLDERGRLWLLGRAMGPPGLHPFAIEIPARTWPGVTAAACVPRDQGPALLFIAGDRTQAALWQASAEKLGGFRVIALDTIPMDRRHRSKPDYAALLKSART
jgi:acyl-CoA synthetase (AMP-forming)/AMP-acid ligase II